MARQLATEGAGPERGRQVASGDRAARTARAVIAAITAGAALAGCATVTRADAVDTTQRAAIQSLVAAVNAAPSPAAQQQVLLNLVHQQDAAAQRACQPATTRINVEIAWSGVRSEPANPSVFTVPVRVTNSAHTVDIGVLTVTVDGQQAYLAPLCIR